MKSQKKSIDDAREKLFLETLKNNKNKTKRKVTFSEDTKKNEEEADNSKVIVKGGDLNGTTNNIKVSETDISMDNNSNNIKSESLFNFDTDSDTNNINDFEDVEIPRKKSNFKSHDTIGYLNRNHQFNLSEARHPFERDAMKRWNQLRYNQKDYERDRTQLDLIDNLKKVLNGVIPIVISAGILGGFYYYSKVTVPKMDDRLLQQAINSYGQQSQQQQQQPQHPVNYNYKNNNNNNNTRNYEGGFLLPN